MSLRVPPDELSFTFVRSSGAGGQNVNKVASKAVMRWTAATSRALTPGVRERFLAKYASRLTTDGEIVLSSDGWRDRPRNVADCVERLHAMLESVRVAPKPRRPTKPTRASQRRRIDAKRAQSRKKHERRGEED